MGLYFNNQRVLVHLGSKLYKLNVGSPMVPVEIVETDRILSSDLFVLRDKNGIYLVPKAAPEVPPTALISSDGYIITDINDTYLLLKESE